MARFSRRSIMAATEVALAAGIEGRGMGQNTPRIPSITTKAGTELKTAVTLTLVR